MLCENGLFQALLCRNLNACEHVAECLLEEEALIEAGHVAAANEDKAELCHLLHGVDLSMKIGTRQHIAPSQAFDNKRSSTVLKTFCKRFAL